MAYSKYRLRFLSAFVCLALWAACLGCLGNAFTMTTTTTPRLPRIPTTSLFSSSFRVPFQDVIQNLTSSEQSVATVAQLAGPSVVYVTSILPYQSTRRRGRLANTNEKNFTKNPPAGQVLGSGSGFVVESDGYVVTNYHVIDQAYEMQQFSQQYQDWVSNNTTQYLGSTLGPVVQSLLPTLDAPRVYIRGFSSNGNSKEPLQECRVVDVKPELDVAVLKLVNATTVPNTSEFGSSSKLVVGQSVVAIGNPFGLDSTVTAGVVSALNRDLSTSSRGGATPARGVNVIRNCIQSDCAINSGNSGGPLLDLKGRVVGVNTAIVTSSGAFAGIGFAIPSDQVQPVVYDMIRRDRRRHSTSNRNGYLGISIISSSTCTTETNSTKCWVTKVQPGSPGSGAGIQALRVSEQGTLVEGDAIVAIGGRPVSSYEDLREQIDKCVKGEEVSLTLEDVVGVRRVVYVRLGAAPVP